MREGWPETQCGLELNERRNIDWRNSPDLDYDMSGRGVLFVSELNFGTRWDRWPIKGDCYLRSARELGDSHRQGSKEDPTSNQHNIKTRPSISSNSFSAQLSLFNRLRRWFNARWWCSNAGSRYRWSDSLRVLAAMARAAWYIPSDCRAMSSMRYRYGL
jgi:hypothetical protein